ncbi:MAG: NAD-binding protein [Salinirussus sp.]
MGSASDETPEEAIEEVFYPHERIPLINWRQFSGAKPTVVLTGVIALFAFVTGLSNLSQEAIALNGPLAPVLPAAPAVARFAGVLFAFALGVVTAGLQRRKRIAWRVALVLLPALAVLPLTTLHARDGPLLLLILVATPLLIRNRSGFDQPMNLSPLQIASLSSIVGVGLYGTIGAYGLRNQFATINGWADAIYYVIVTFSTVGYGDITPTSATAKFFSLSVIIFGTGAFTIAVGALIGPAIESRMASAFGNMTASELNLLEDHVVVLGYGDVTESLLDELGDETEVVVVTPDAETAASLDDEGGAGGRSVNVLTGDPTDESVLEDARLGVARGVVVGSDDDARDTLAVLAAENVNSDVRIVAAANEAKHVDKLRTVGADEVINPLTIGGRLLGRSVLDESDSASVTSVLDEDSSESDAADDSYTGRRNS